MKRKYYFHRINQPLQADHVVYRLWVGESVREQRLLADILAWAFSQGATVMSWSEDIDYYLQYESERVFPGRGLLDFGFIQADITAADALKHIKANDWDIYEKNLPQPKTFFVTLRKCSPVKIDQKKSSIKSYPVLTEIRKNLSQSTGYSRTIISFV